MKNYRPDGWKMPEYFTFQVLEEGKWVTHKTHSGDSLRDNVVFEASADAMLKAIVGLLKACDGELVSRDNKPFMATFEMPAETWQALSRGIK